MTFCLSLFVVPFSSSEGIRCTTPFEWLHSFCLCLFSCVSSVLFVSSVASSVSVTANRDFPISAQPSVSLLRQRRLQLSVGCVRRPSEGVAQPSEGVVQPSNFFWSCFVLGFGFHPTGDHCLETSFLLSLQQSPFSMAVSLSPWPRHPAAKNHRSTCCSICYNSPPSSRQGRILFVTHSRCPRGSFLPREFSKSWSP